MAAMLWVHGLDEVNNIPVRIWEIKPDTSTTLPPAYASAKVSAMLVNKWKTAGNGTLNGNRWYSVDPNEDAPTTGNNPELVPAEDRAVPQNGVRGQGNSPNPPSTFGNHFVVVVEENANSLQLFDPSYGTKSESAKLWELASLFGVKYLGPPGQNPPIGFVADTSHPPAATVRLTTEQKHDADKFFPIPPPN